MDSLIPGHLVPLVINDARNKRAGECGKRDAESEDKESGSPDPRTVHPAVIKDRQDGKRMVRRARVGRGVRGVGGLLSEDVTKGIYGLHDLISLYAIALGTDDTMRKPGGGGGGGEVHDFVAWGVGSEGINM